MKKWPKVLRAGDILVFRNQSEKSIQAVIDRGGDEIEVVLATGEHSKNSSIFSLFFRRENGSLHYPENIIEVRQKP